MAQLTVAQKNTSNSTSVGLTGVTAGRTLVAVVNAHRFFSATPALSSISGGGATWTTYNPCAIAELAVWIAIGDGTTGGSVTVTASGTWENASVTLYELSANGEYDTGSIQTGDTSNPLTCASTGTLASDEGICFMGICGPDTGNGFTFNGGFTEDYDAVLGTWGRYGVGHLEVTGTTALTPSIDAVWDFFGAAQACVVVKPSGGGGGPTFTPRRALTGVGF